MAWVRARVVRTGDECGRHHTLFSQPPVALTEKSWETVHQAWRNHSGNGGAVPQRVFFVGQPSVLLRRRVLEPRNHKTFFLDRG